MTSPLRSPRPEFRPRPEARPRVEAPVISLRVVEPATRRIRPGLIVAAAVVVVFGAMLAAAVIQSLMVSGQRHVDETNRRIGIEQDNLQNAKVALARSQSPARVTQAARALGMVPATDAEVITLDPSPSTTDRTDTDQPTSPGPDGSRSGELAGPPSRTAEGTTAQP